MIQFLPFVLRFWKPVAAVLIFGVVVFGVKRWEHETYERGYNQAVADTSAERQAEVERQYKLGYAAGKRVTDARARIDEDARRATERIDAATAVCPDVGPDALRLFNDAIGADTPAG